MRAWEHPKTNRRKRTGRLVAWQRVKNEGANAAVGTGETAGRESDVRRLRGKGPPHVTREKGQATAGWEGAGIGR